MGFFYRVVTSTYFDQKESVPKITFGEFMVRDNKKYLPISIEAHHDLLDGFRLAKYLAGFQRQMEF